MTAYEYRRVYERISTEGVTAWEKANSRAHWDKLRTASRYCMEADIRRFRRISEQARRAGDIQAAQSYTAEAWRLSVALHCQFLKPGRLAWAAKAKAMKSAGKKPVNKSKRHTRTPIEDLSACLLMPPNRKGNRLAKRHAERLAVLALTGCRPAELMAGVKISLWRHPKNGEPAVIVEVIGAKVNDKRGQEKRRIGFPVSGTFLEALHSLCVERGGFFTIATTSADYRSLNRALHKSGLSCYSFRHAFGSELKQSIQSGSITPQKAAQAMGHRSTKSLAYYGTRRQARGGRRLAVGASSEVRVIAVTKEMKQKSRDRLASTPAGRLNKSPPKTTKPR